MVNKKSIFKKNYCRWMLETFFFVRYLSNFWGRATCWCVFYLSGCKYICCILSTISCVLSAISALVCLICKKCLHVWMGELPDTRKNKHFKTKISWKVSWKVWSFENYLPITLNTDFNQALRYWLKKTLKRQKKNNN